MPVVIDEDSDDYLRMLSMNVAGDTTTTNEQSSSATTAILENAAAVVAVNNSNIYSNTRSSPDDVNPLLVSSSQQGVNFGLQNATTTSADKLHIATSINPIPATVTANATTNSEAELLAASASPSSGIEKPKPNGKY